MIGGMSRRMSSPVFVGRAAELERLADALERAASGRPSLVLVAGEAGVGKSRLLDEFLARSAASGTITLAGACLDLGEGGLPFAPFAEALRGWARVLDPEVRAAVVGPAGGPLALLVPDLRQTAGLVEDAVDPAGRQARLFDAVLAVVGRLAAERAGILVLEDLHWADGSTRDLIRFLVRNLRDERLLIIGTYRSDDLHRRHPLVPLLSELERSDRVERLELRRFGRDELRDQLEGITGTSPTDVDVDAFLERSDGIPFYVEELLAGGRDAGSAMPASLREILGIRLGSLAGEAVAVVRAASVVGVRVPHDRLTAVTDLDEQRLDSGLRQAIDAGVLVAADPSDGPAFAFRHALLREAAYDELLSTEQVRLHGRLAGHLADRLTGEASDDPAVVADFAVHAYYAQDQRRALEGSVRAMRVLAESGAFREALGDAERALELWPRVADAPSLAGIDHVALLAFAARMAGNTGRPDRAVSLGQEALREMGSSADAERTASLLADLWTAAFEAWDRDVTAATAERMADILAGLPAARLKALLLNLNGYDQGFRSRIRVAVAAHEEALAIARSIGDERLVAMIAPMLASTLAGLNRAGRAADVLASSELRAENYDSTPWLFWAATERCMALWWLGRFHDAVAVAQEAIPAASRYGLDRRVIHWLTPTDPLFELGRLDEALEMESRATAAAGGHVAMGQRRIAISCDILRGQFDQARLLIAERQDYSAFARMGTLHLLGLLARAEGDLAAVRAVVDEALELAAGGEVDGPLWFILGDAVEAAADAAVIARRRRRAEDGARAQADGRRWMERLTATVNEARADGGPGAFCEATMITAEAELTRLEGQAEPGGVGAGRPAMDRSVPRVSHGLRAVAARRSGAGDRRRSARRRGGAAGSPGRRGIARCCAAARVDRDRRPPCADQPGIGVDIGHRGGGGATAGVRPAAHRPRVRRPGPGGRGSHEPRDRRPPVHQREDRQRPRLERDGEARRPVPLRGGGDCRTTRPPAVGQVGPSRQGAAERCATRSERSRLQAGGRTRERSVALSTDGRLERETGFEPATFCCAKP